jgi:transposase
LETNPTRMCRALVGLPEEVVVVGVSGRRGEPLSVHVELDGPRPWCGRCGMAATVKDRPQVTLVDLPCFGRPTRLVWRKRRWRCPNADCGVGSWTEQDPRIAAPRQVMTNRAVRWVTEQVGRRGRTVNEIAIELNCDWHTVNDTVIAYGTPLVEHPDRIGQPTALGSTRSCSSASDRGAASIGRRRSSTSAPACCSTLSLVGTTPERASGSRPAATNGVPGIEWGHWICPARTAPCSTRCSPTPSRVADPFHLVKLANSKLDEVRRRVQNETLGHRGRKHDPLYRARRLLTKADERLDAKGRGKLLGLLEAGDPKVRCAPPGTPKKWSARSMTTPNPSSPSSSSTGSVTTSKTNPVRRRSTSSAAPCCAGKTRSSPGTALTSPTARPKRSTT